MSTANAGDQGATETVELPEPDVDEGGGSGESAGESGQSQGNGESKQTRKERRKSEFQEAQETARLAREEAAAERRERERLASEIAELRGRFSEAQRREQQQAQPDKYADKIAALEDEAQLILQQVANSKDPTEQKSLMKKWNEKNREAIRLDIQRDNEKKERENPQQRQTQGMDPRSVAIWTALEADYPIIADGGKSGAAFRAQTDLHLNVLIAQGKPDNLATFKAAAALAARDLKVGGHDGKPNRGAYSGNGNGDGAGGAGGNGTGTVEWGPQQKALARALANRLGEGWSDDEAKAQWLKRVGPGVARRMSEE